MLTSELTTPIREAISDEKSPYRHGDAELFRAIGRALRALHSVHPEAFMVEDYQLDPPAVPTSLTGTVDLDPYWQPAIVHHVAYEILSQDSEDENNRALAADHWAHWIQEI
jgi:hypothetical protein